MRSLKSSPQRLALAVVGALFAWHPIIDSDALWHLTLGRGVLRHGSRSFPEPSAHPAFTDPVVAAEWLWEVATYLLYTAGGYPALSILLVAMGAVIGHQLARLIEERAGEGRRFVVLLVGLLVMAVVAKRLLLRPQLAFFVCLLVFVRLAYAHRLAGPGRARLRSALGLVAVAWLWPQLHGSFVLAAPLLIICALPLSMDAPQAKAPEDVRAARQGFARVLLAVLLGALSSAHGVGVVQYVLAHGGGDAVAHIHDMRPLDWSGLGPFGDPHQAPLLVLWLLGAAGMLVERRVYARELALAALGALLAHTAGRFGVAAALLATPLASCGGVALQAHLSPLSRRARISVGLLAALAVAGLCLRSASYVAMWYGPMGQLGLAEGAHPRAAVAHLSQQAPGGRVLGEFRANSLIGFELDGRVRTYVDGRTPMYFDATDYALYRDASVHPQAMERLLRRYGANAAVWAREDPGCALLAARWVPVVIEAGFTTFAPPGSAEAAPGLAPCGERYVAPDACERGAPLVAAGIGRFADLAPGPFWDYLRAELALQCGGTAPERVLQWLGRESAVVGYGERHRALRITALLEAGRVDAAVELLAAALDAEELRAVHVLGTPAGGRVPIPAAHAALDLALRSMGDSAPPRLRVQLAQICVARGDGECVRFHAMRAALLGAPGSAELLDWLVQHHPAARVRADARALRSVL